MNNQIKTIKLPDGRSVKCRRLNAGEDRKDGDIYSSGERINDNNLGTQGKNGFECFWAYRPIPSKTCDFEKGIRGSQSVYHFDVEKIEKAIGAYESAQKGKA